MATFFLDYEGGNDGNSGVDFANRWKTITSGATAARIAPGDTIRVRASPDPTSLGSATWTNGSRNIALAGALTATVSMCESAWTASADVTSTATATNVIEGTNCAKHAIGAAFTTGLASYFALASTDFSSYQQLSLYIRCSIALTAGDISITLCSDAVGAVPVDTFLLPATLADRGMYVTIDKGSALGAAIQSVAINVVVDRGACDIYLDNIIACKASSAADSLSLTSLIGKNSGTEHWYCIQSINGTTVVLGSQPNDSKNSAMTYYGTTEAVTTYKRETIKTPVSTAVFSTIQDAGTLAGGMINFEGGWGRSDDMATQSGETYYDGQNARGTGLSMNAQPYVSVNKLSFFRFQSGVTSVNKMCTVSNMRLGGHSGTALNTSVSCNNSRFTNIYLSNSDFCNITLNGNNNSFTGLYITGITNANNMEITGARNVFDTGVISRGINSGVLFLDISNNAGAANNTFKNFTFATNTTADVRFYTGPNYFENCLFLSTTESLNSSASGSNATIFSHKHDQTAENHIITMEGGTIQTEVGADRRTASGIAWKLSPTNAIREVNYPVSLSLAKIACIANTLVTVSVWMKRTNVAVTGRLVCKGGQIAGVVADVTSSAASSAVYELVTITFTPTEAGVVEITAEAYGGTTHSVYVDDMEISQA